MKRVRVKPSKAQSAMGFAVGLVFCGIGIFVAIPTFGAFGIFWTIIAAVITVTNGMNAFGKKGVASSEIIIDDDEEMQESMSEHEAETYSKTQSVVSATQKRLDNLRDLYNAGIITKEEFEQRRNDIINDAVK